VRLTFDGVEEVAVAASVSDALAVLENRDEVYGLVRDLLHPSATAERWVLADLHLGPVVINPAVDVSVTRTRDTVEVAGNPVPGRTPSWLTVRLAAVADGNGATVRSNWEVQVDVPGPQLLAGSIRPLASASVRRTAHQLTDRLADRLAEG
jgi:hypothetical protein